MKGWAMTVTAAVLIGGTALGIAAVQEQGAAVGPRTTPTTIRVCQRVNAR